MLIIVSSPEICIVPKGVLRKELDNIPAICEKIAQEDHHILFNIAPTPSKSNLNSLSAFGADILYRVDLNYGILLKKIYPDALSLFITYPSDIIKFQPSSVKEELRIAQLEYDYVITNNGVDATSREIAYLIDDVRNTSMRIDLHAHSSESLTAQEVIDKAIQRGFGVLAITNRNQILDISELQKTNSDINIIPGFEVNCFFKASSGNKYKIDILGLGLNGNQWKDFDFLFEYLQDERRTEIIALYKKLYSNYGIDLSPDEEFVTYHSSTYPLITAVHQIQKAAGIPVLAHPLDYSMPSEDFRELILVFKETAHGNGALEVYCPRYTNEQSRELLDIAKNMDLMPSAGSNSDTLDTEFSTRLCRKLLKKCRITCY